MDNNDNNEKMSQDIVYGIVILLFAIVCYCLDIVFIVCIVFIV